MLSDFFKVMGTIVIVSVALSAAFCWVSDKEAKQRAAHKVDSAHRYAKQLMLKDYQVSCKESAYSCACSISWETEIGRQLETFDCCGGGCSQDSFSGNK